MGCEGRMAFPWLRVMCFQSRNLCSGCTPTHFPEGSNSVQLGGGQAAEGRLRPQLRAVRPAQSELPPDAEGHVEGWGSAP